MFRILGAILGFIFFGGFIGALLGYFVGLLIDNATTSAGSRATQQASYEYYTQRTSKNEFASMLMVLSAAVMKADGKVLKSELEFVKSFFRNQFGNQFTPEHLKDLKRFLNTPTIPIQRICLDIRSRLKLEDRVLLLHFLFGIAKADNDVSSKEVEEIEKISRFLGIPPSDYLSVKNMFYREVDADYKILEIQATATDDEIKKAYRQLALKFHPDRVAHLGEEYQKRAKEKFQQIQKAYENIKKKRGFV